MEEIERVAGGVQTAQPAATRYQARSTSAREQDRSGNDEHEEKNVAQRVRQVGRDRGRAPTGQVLDPPKGEGGTERRCSEAGDCAVEPERRHQAQRVPSHHQDEREVGEREEEEVEEIGQRGRRPAWRRAATRS